MQGCTSGMSHSTTTLLEMHWKLGTDYRGAQLLPCVLLAMTKKAENGGKKRADVQPVTLFPLITGWWMTASSSTIPNTPGVGVFSLYSGRGKCVSTHSWLQSVSLTLNEADVAPIRVFCFVFFVHRGLLWAGKLFLIEDEGKQSEHGKNNKMVTPALLINMCGHQYL